VREYEYFLTLLVTAAVTYLLTPVVRKLAIKIKAVPATRDRDVHAEPIPRMGGLAMYFGVAAGLIVATELVPFRTVIAGSGLVSGLLLAGGLIVIVGIIDDKYDLNSIAKLAGQIAAAGVLVANGAVLSTFPLPKEGVFDLTHNEGVVVTIVLIVATINAVNFIDGLDGLAAGIVCIAALSFFFYYYSLTRVTTPRLAIPVEAVPALAAILLVGACIGFLPHNFYPARIFMGDTGSMLLGLLLAYIPISAISQLDPTDLSHSANRYAEILPFLLPAAVMVIPYTDLLRAVVRRTRAGLSPLAPDRKHLHHRMLDIGHSHRSSVLILYAWAILFASAVVGLSILATPLLILAGITLFAVLVLVLLSIPRLRWWDRGKATAAPAPGESAPRVPAAPVLTAPVTSPGQVHEETKPDLLGVLTWRDGQQSGNRPDPPPHIETTPPETTPPGPLPSGSVPSGSVPAAGQAGPGQAGTGLAWIERRPRSGDACDLLPPAGDQADGKPPPRITRASGSIIP
jgi:UDP-GlcNAc:undecaprenyl-phosphate GlcNAc-1-phosphate transferase